MTGEPPVLTVFDPSTGIARITFNRPEKLNAIDQKTAEAFRDAAEWAATRAGLRLILLDATGRAFVAGGDIETFADPRSAPAAIDRLLAAMNAGLLTLRKAPAPLVTAVQGMAAGAGFALALSGDLVFAARSARFAVAYTRLGGTPDCGLTHALSRRIGPARTVEMLINDATLDAPAAAAMGLVTEVLDDDGFAAAVAARASRLAGGPTRAFVAARDLLDRERSFEEQITRERQAFIAAAGSADFAEGVAAFRARRAPRFEGQ
ncbi:enoyl-CoA hydratase/isomerase family protein [Martelella soudanensis]|uniref:enoyl-CoA hydratase/isomerase family protein n=1 Tax=unclassified Martelella TaxID=2629616 RepID=UPI0015DF68FD|nr:MULTISPECIES: enoyl-CoA hydratase/isomerase family protein [unclassified Martelella]